ncbi:MAG TPA: translocation/assembly module TamB domain-containing protein [Usitatibacter sp.]|nr:translocation/assembly module TamB domain-containing protein [Usitatibacter sp.]
MATLDTTPPPPPRRSHRVLAIAGAVLLAILVAVAVLAYWLLATSSGAQFLLGRAVGAIGKGAAIEGIEGQVGGRLRIARIVIDLPDLSIRVEDVDMDTSPLFVGRLTVRRLHVRNVEVRTASSGAAASLPASFKPPYPIRLEDGAIGRFLWGAIGTHDKDVEVKDIVLRGGGDARHWTLDEAAAVTSYGKARIAGTVASSPPFDVAIEGGFDGTLVERAVHASARLGGSLKSLEARAEGTISGARASVLAKLEPFSKSPVKSLALTATGVDLSQVAGSLPRTQLAVDAKLTPRGDGFAGPVRVENAQPGAWDGHQLPFSSASADVAASAQGAELSGLDLRLAGGGTARGAARMGRDGTAQADLDIAAVDLAALHGSLQKTRLDGKVSISGDRAAQRFEVALTDPRFEVEARAELASERLAIESAQVRTGGGAATGKGTIALSGTREFRFEGEAHHLDPSAFVKTSRGDLNFSLAADGKAAEPATVHARVDIAPSTYAGLPASGRIDVAGSKRRIARADVDLALGEARLTAKGSFGARGDAMDLTLHAPNLSSLAKPFDVALAGKLDATGRLTGTFDSPAGNLTVDGANLALPANTYIQQVALTAQAGAAADSPIEATLKATGIAMGKDVPPTPMAQTLEATLKGTRASHRLDARAVMTRENTVRAAVQGGLDPKAKVPEWNGRIESIEMTGRGKFALTAPASLAVSAERIELGDATLRGEWGEAHLQTTRWTPRTLDFKGSSLGLEMHTLARDLRLGDIPRSNLVLAGGWDIHAAQFFEGTLDVKRVRGDLRVGDPPTPLGLDELEFHARAVRGQARAIAHIAGERVGNIDGEGAAAIVRGESGWSIDKAAPVTAHLVASLADLAAVAPWLGPDARLAGSLRADVNVTGTAADPRFSGTARAQKLAVREPQSGFEVSEGEIALRMTGQSLVIERFSARTPWHAPPEALERLRRVEVPAEGGTISAEGSIDLLSRQGAIRVKADKVPITQLPRRFVAVSGEASLEAAAGGVISVTGKFAADGGWIGALAEAPPTPSDDVVVVRASQPAPVEEKKREPIHLDLTASLNDRLWFEGRGLDTRLGGELRITGDVGGPLRATGSIRTLQGTYEGYGQKLTVERGVLVFAGPLDNPKLNVLALRKGLPVEAGVDVTGSVARPRVRLVSTPEVPESEKLSWLVLGRGASDAAPGDMSVLAAAASALLGGSGESYAKKFGIDEVRIGRSDAGSVLGVLPESTVAGKTGSPAAADVVTVGKSLNRNFHLAYEQGLADAEATLKLTYIVSRQFQVLVRAGYLPGLDAVWRWTLK